MIDASIIIVNYNTFELTKNCIQSILEKTQEIRYEIILVDNGSNECSPDLFKDLFPQIILIKSIINLGFSKGNNLGIAQAQGDTIILLNSDTILVNNAIQISHKIISEDSKVGALCGQLLFPDNEPQPATGKFPSLRKELLELVRYPKLLSPRGKALFYLHSFFDHKTRIESDWVSGAFFSIKKSTLDKFPGQKLHENFFMYFEDVQWCFHIKSKLGMKILFDPEPKVIHVDGGSDGDHKLKLTNKYFKVVVPNKYDWMIGEKGLIYTRFFFLCKALLHFTFFNRNEILKSRIYFSLAAFGINQYSKNIEKIINSNTLL